MTLRQAQGDRKPARTDYCSSQLAKMFKPVDPSSELENLVRKVVRQELRQIYAEPRMPIIPGRRPTVAQCIGLASEAFNIPIMAITGKSRHRHVKIARFAAMWLARETTGLSFPVIARPFKRHHSTILHGVREAQLAYNRDQHFTACVNAMFDALRNQQ